MTKRLSRAVKKRKRTRVDWRKKFELANDGWLRANSEYDGLDSTNGRLRGDLREVDAACELWRNAHSAALSELTRYRLICAWACQRIEKLEAVSSDWEASWLKAAHCCHEWVETALERSKEITKLRRKGASC